MDKEPEAWFRDLIPNTNAQRGALDDPKPDLGNKEALVNFITPTKGEPDESLMSIAHAAPTTAKKSIIKTGKKGAKSTLKKTAKKKLLRGGGSILEDEVVLPPPPPDNSTSHLISEVLMASLKIFFFFALSAWLALDMLNALVPQCFFLTYFPAFLSGIMAMIPLVPSWIVFIPATAQLSIAGYPVTAVLHFGLHVVLWYTIPNVMYKKVSIEALVPPYFTGLSVFAGLWVFGWPGVVYGPVVINIVPVLLLWLKYRLQDNNNGVNYTTIPA
jgi:hypothetical protein